MTPRVLLVPGHVGIEALGPDGLRPWRDRRRLRRSTGAAGERELTAAVADRLQRALLERGLDAFVTDAVYHEDAYGAPAELVLALHAHRDRGERARAAIPDVVEPPFISAAALDRSAAWVGLFRELYPELTGIPLTAGVTIDMRQLYTWDYVPLEAAAVIVEMGHLDDDAAVLLERNAARVVRALAAITLRHFGLPDRPPHEELLEALGQIGALAARARELVERGA